MKNKAKISSSGDIHDNEKDAKYLQSEEVIFNLPEVKDIPGQEHIKPPKMNSFADVTISSDDEEGKGLLDFEDDLDDDLDNDLDDESDVSREESNLLEQSVNRMASADDEDQANATLDNIDEDGDLLNEDNDVSGRDLDVPGSEDDDNNEEIGEEDEENNSYSLGADKKD